MSFLQSRTNLGPQGIGKPVARKEDDRLLRGEGRYTDDFNLPGQAYASVVRSPHAHARIRSIDTSEALAMPGVLAVLTGVTRRTAEARFRSADHPQSARGTAQAPVPRPLSFASDR